MSKTYRKSKDNTIVKESNNNNKKYHSWNDEKVKNNKNKYLNELYEDEEDEQ